LGHLQVVDASGDSFGVAHHGNGTGYDDGLKQLHELGLLEINAAGLIYTGNQWMLAVVQPVKTSTGLLGAVSAGWLLDGRTLSGLNFDRADPLLMLFDPQGQIIALSGPVGGGPDGAVNTGAAAEPKVLANVDHELLARAKNQQISFSKADISGEQHRAAYAPLMLRGEPVAVFGVALDPARTNNLRNGLLASTVVVTGLVALVTLAGGYFLARVISRPILKLKNAAEDIAMLKLDTRIDVESYDEVGSLASSFNFMTEELQRLYSGLTEEVAERTQTNERLTEEIVERLRVEEELRTLAVNLERSNTELQQFASIASHDLQEPVRKIRTFGDRLRDRARSDLTEKHQDYLDRLLNAAGRMQTLINDLLIYSRVTTKANPFVSVDLNVIAKEVLADLEVTIEATMAQVDVGDLPTISADPTQMGQLLQNLISNSLKFRKEGERPIVKIRNRHLNGATGGVDGALNGCDAMELTVEDNGIGFDEMYLERIFGVFQRLYSRNEFPGTGIGLVLCRKIVDRHNGDLTAKSTPGHGAKFIATLPVYHETD
jgi:signal transduction histidine kinase